MSSPTDIRLALPKADRRRIAFGVRDESKVLGTQIRQRFHALRSEMSRLGEMILSDHDSELLANQLRWIADSIDELRVLDRDYRTLTHDIPWRELITLSGKGLSRSRQPGDD